MTIVYRVSPFKQHNPSPIYADDKYNLVQMCHESFLNAKTTEKVIYLVDRCDWKFPGETIYYEAGSRAGSVLAMYDVAKKLEGKVLFIEDDYLWRPKTIKHIWNALDVVNIVSPYDHPDHYVRWPDYKTLVHKKITYRSAPSNTHTFAVHTDYLRKHLETFNHYQDLDHPLFEALPDDVWQPVPSFATHMVSGLLAPNVDWSQFYL